MRGLLYPSCTCTELLISCKHSLLAVADRRGFIFCRQPSLVHPHAIPPPLVFLPTEKKQTLSTIPPPRPVKGFQTMVLERDFRESLFAKKSRLVLKVRCSLSKCSLSRAALSSLQLNLPLLLSQFTYPIIPAFPRNTPIPYHLTLLLLAPPSSSSSSSSSSTPPPQLNMPSPSDLQMILVRKVLSQANGASQIWHQPVGNLVHLGSEPRTWYTPHEWKHERGERRWGGEIVVAGEIMVGGAAAPSFGTGLLGCEVSPKVDGTNGLFCSLLAPNTFLFFFSSPSTTSE